MFEFEIKGCVECVGLVLRTLALFKLMNVNGCNICWSAELCGVIY